MTEGEPRPRFKSKTTGESFDTYEKAAGAGHEDASVLTPELPTTPPEKVQLKLNSAGEMWYRNAAGEVVKLREHEAIKDERDRQHMEPDTPPLPGFPEFSRDIEDGETSDEETDTPSAATPERAQAQPEELEVMRALFKFSQAYTYDPSDLNFAATKDALREAVTGSVENVWPVLRDRIVTEIKNAPPAIVLEHIWDDFDKASLNLRSIAVAPAAAAQAPSLRAPRQEDWRRERDQRINAAVNSVKERHLRDGVALETAIREAAGTLQASDEFTFAQQLRKIPDVDKHAVEAALKKRAENVREVASPTAEMHTGRTPAEISASANRWREENEKLRKL